MEPLGAHLASPQDPETEVQNQGDQGNVYEEEPEVKIWARNFSRKAYLFMNEYSLDQNFELFELGPAILYGKTRYMGHFAAIPLGLNGVTGIN